MTIIIDPQQTTFISGRQILDGFMIANEIMHRIKKDWREGFLLKVGFNKAFNPVNCSYLEEVIMYMGFGDKWISLAHECISASQMAILINGSPSKEFRF
jgi:hypothetical protein